MNEAVQPRMRRPVAIAMALASIVAFAILIALGTWQVQRLAWKEGLIATIESRVGGQPETLGAIEQRFASSADVDYWPVTVEGTFRHDAERHYFATWQGQSGYHVLTPLELADGRLVFVNRGFVPFDRKDPATRPEGQVEGQVTVTGLARTALAEKPSFIVPDNDPAANIFYWKDLDAMVESAGLGQQEVLPFLVDADAAPNPGGVPVGGVTIIDMPNSHLQYAVTWYGLAAALAGVMGVWLWRSRRRMPPAP